MVVKRAGPVIGSENQLDGPSISKSSGIKCLVIGELMERRKKQKRYNANDSYLQLFYFVL